jgi:hypothetical protein
MGIDMRRHREEVVPNAVNSGKPVDGALRFGWPVQRERWRRDVDRFERG